MNVNINTLPAFCHNAKFICLEILRKAFFFKILDSKSRQAEVNVVGDIASITVAILVDKFGYEF